MGTPPKRVLAGGNGSARHEAGHSSSLSGVYRSMYLSDLNKNNGGKAYWPTLGEFLGLDPINTERVVAILRLGPLLSGIQAL